MIDPRDLIDIPVHPAADVLPMLDADALADLADGIKGNGLLEPIKLDSDGVLVDGRNRYVASKMAGIEPLFETLPPDTDIGAYIVERNLNRRHSSVGQRAITLAEMSASGHVPHGAVNDPRVNSGACMQELRHLIHLTPTPLPIHPAEHAGSTGLLITGGWLTLSGERAWTYVQEQPAATGTRYAFTRVAPHGDLYRWRQDWTPRSPMPTEAGETVPSVRKRRCAFEWAYGISPFQSSRRRLGNGSWSEGLRSHSIPPPAEAGGLLERF